MLLTTPVISPLKKNYSDAKVDALLYQDTILTLSGNLEINTLYGIKGKETKASEKTANFLHLIKILRANKYDLIVGLVDQWMIAILVRLLNACMKISQDYHHRQSAFRRNSLTHLMLLQGGNAMESNLSVLAPLGLGSLVKQMTMSYPPASWKHMRREPDHAGVGQSYVVIQLAVRQAFKCWDSTKFSVVINTLHARGYEVVLTSGSDKGDLACINRAVRECQTLPVTALAGKMTPPGLGALIDYAQLFIGVDSALVHVVTTVNTPLISLFGAVDYILWHPWSNNMVQFWMGDYRGMPARDWHDRNEMYLSVIPVTGVIVAVDKLLPPSTAGTSLRSLLLAYINVFPLTVCSVILCVLFRRSPPEVIMFEFIPSRGKANALMYLN